MLPLQKGLRHQPGQLPIAGQRLAEQRDPCGRGALAGFANPRIDPDQRLHAGSQRLFVEFDHRKQIALVGERDRRHAGGRHRRHQLGHPNDPIDQGVFGVQAQMHE